MSVANASYLPLIGKSIDTAERASLQCSIPLLSARFNGAPAEFWGKVCGYKNDYLIAQVLPSGALGPRLSFYSTDGGNNWSLLEELTEEQAALCEELRGMYQGIPSYEYKMRKDVPPVPEPSVEMPEADDVLKAAKDALAKAGAGSNHDDSDRGPSADDEDDEEAEDEEQDDEENEEEDLEEIPPPKKDRRPKYVVVSITEAKRLSHFVTLHDTCCRLAVRGEYILANEGGAASAAAAAADGQQTSGHAPTTLLGAARNRAFAGQPLHYAVKPSCYMRLYAAGSPERNARLYGATHNPHTDFLRPITDDAPQGVWSVKYDPSLNVVAVTNWLFEGTLFWYRPDSLEKGQVYCGNGERNFEVLFML